MQIHWVGCHSKEDWDAIVNCLVSSQCLICWKRLCSCMLGNPPIICWVKNIGHTKFYFDFKFHIEWRISGKRKHSAHAQRQSPFSTQSAWANQTISTSSWFVGDCNSQASEKGSVARNAKLHPWGLYCIFSLQLCSSSGFSSDETCVVAAPPWLLPTLLWVLGKKRRDGACTQFSSFQPRKLAQSFPCDCCIPVLSEWCGKQLWGSSR